MIEWSACFVYALSHLCVLNVVTVSVVRVEVERRRTPERQFNSNSLRAKRRDCIRCVRVLGSADHSSNIRKSSHFFIWNDEEWRNKKTHTNTKTNARLSSMCTWAFFDIVETPFAAYFHFTHIHSIPFLRIIFSMSFRCTLFTHNSISDNRRMTEIKWRKDSETYHWRAILIRVQRMWNIVEEIVVRIMFSWKKFKERE